MRMSRTTLSLACAAGTLALIVGAASSARAEGKSLTAHIAGMTVGGVFTLAIHAIDAVRAKIGR